MKKLLLALFALTVASLVPTQAQGTFSVQTLNTGTNVIAASGTLSPTNAIITARKHLNVGLQAEFALSGTGTGNVVLSFAKSLDGVTYETVPSVTLTIAGSGTNVVSGLTNVSMGAAGSLKLVSVTNANTPSTVAGLAVKYAIKPGEK